MLAGLFGDGFAERVELGLMVAARFYEAELCASATYP